MTTAMENRIADSRRRDRALSRSGTEVHPAVLKARGFKGRVVGRKQQDVASAFPGRTAADVACATHEAGHVVACVHFDLQVEEARVGRRSHRDGRVRAGQTIWAAQPWDGLGASARTRALIAVAGQAAETLAGIWANVSSDDVALIAAAAGQLNIRDLSAWIDELMGEAFAILGARLEDIDLIATGLLVRHEGLSDGHVRRILQTRSGFCSYW